MKVENLECSFNEIFKKLRPQIRGQTIGVLQSVIYQILDSDPELAFQICQKYEIERNSCLQDDLVFSDNVIHTTSVNQQNIVRKHKTARDVGEFFKKASAQSRIPSEGDEPMEYIIIAAIILIGAYFSRIYLKLSPTSSASSRILTKQHIPTSICLAAPASAVYGLTEGELITRNKIIDLVESATEFLCLDSIDADKNTIDTLSQETSQESQLKFYIRIDIKSGEEIIGSQAKYLIKRDLPNPTEGKIIQIGRLRDASVLRNFNRV